MTLRTVTTAEGEHETEVFKLVFQTCKRDKWMMTRRQPRRKITNFWTKSILQPLNWKQTTYMFFITIDAHLWDLIVAMYAMYAKANWLFKKHKNCFFRIYSNLYRQKAARENIPKATLGNLLRKREAFSKILRSEWFYRHSLEMINSFYSNTIFKSENNFYTAAPSFSCHQILNSWQHPILQKSQDSPIVCPISCTRDRIR